MSPTARRWLLLIVIASAVALIDQLAKSLVLERLVPGQTYVPIPALEAYFRLTFSYNTGAAFGFLPQAGDFFLLLALVIIVALLVFYPRIEANAWLTRVGIALVAGGALGNAIDRLIHGAVIDFVHLQIPGLVSNVSNLADHAIVIGVALILIDNWFIQGRKPAEAAPPPADAP